jgi:hypothetical protein
MFENEGISQFECLEMERFKASPHYAMSNRSGF